MQNPDHASDRRYGAWLRGLISCAGLIGAFGVGLGAAGVHAGGGDLARTASTFLLIHAAAIVAIAGTAARSPMALALLVAATVLALGVTGFSADLAAVAFSGGHLVRGMAPVGGTLMILGWVVVAVSPWFWRAGPKRRP